MLRLLALCVVLLLPTCVTHNITIDDTSPLWAYTPQVCPSWCNGTQTGVKPSWWQVANQMSAADRLGYYNLTATATNLVGASASLTFMGGAIYFYATMSPGGGLMSVTLDKQQPSNLSAALPPSSDWTEQRQTLLYFRTGLDQTREHRFTLQVLGGGVVDVDRVDVLWPHAATPVTSSIPPLSSTVPVPVMSTLSRQSVGGPGPTQSVNSPSRRAVLSNVGAVVGASIGILALLCALVALGAWCYRRHHPSRGAQIIAAHHERIRRTPLVLVRKTSTTTCPDGPYALGTLMHAAAVAAQQQQQQQKHDGTTTTDDAGAEDSVSGATAPGPAGWRGHGGGAGEKNGAVSVSFSTLPGSRGAVVMSTPSRASTPDEGKAHGLLVVQNEPE